MRELPPTGATERDRDFAINQLIRGLGNQSGKVTLTPGATTTTISKPTINKDAAVMLFPATPQAAAQAAVVHVSAVVSGAFTITHNNAADALRTYYYAVIGG